MELSLSFNAADASRIEKYAAEKNMSVLDFVRRAVMKSVNEEQARAKANAEYLAMVDERMADAAAGRRLVSFTSEEWERFSNARELS